MNSADWFAMGGYGLYVWGALGMCGAVIVAEVTLLKLKRQTLMREAAQAMGSGAGDIHGHTDVSSADARGSGA